MKLPIAIFLDKKDTEKLGDKNSVVYKTVVVLLKEIKERTGVEVPVIGTKKNGELFQIDISK
jgi:hypothetical protein